MDRFEAMQRFVCVARTGSFTEAAKRLNLPKSSISSAVQALEQRLGSRLLHRSTRSVSLTEDGEVYLERCLEILADLDALEGWFQSEPEALKGVLRVDMPSRFASMVLLPRLPEFLARHPSLKIKVGTADYCVDLVKEGVDCVIRVGDLQDSSLIAKPLATYPLYNCVSPAYITRYGMPNSLEDLAQHCLVDYVSNFENKQALFEYYANGKTHQLAMPSQIAVNGTDAYLAACLHGLGMIQVPAPGVASLLESGQLVRVLESYEAPAMPVSLLYPSRQQVPRRLQAFMDWIVEIMHQP